MVGYQGCSLNFQGSEGNCHGNQIPAKTDKIAIKKASVLYKVSSQICSDNMSLRTSNSLMLTKI